eukprot:977753-Prorocentrum_minimum.AAC.2
MLIRRRCCNTAFDIVTANLNTHTFRKTSVEPETHPISNVPPSSSAPIQPEKARPFRSLFTPRRAHLPHRTHRHGTRPLPYCSLRYSEGTFLTNLIGRSVMRDERMAITLSTLVGDKLGTCFASYDFASPALQKLNAVVASVAASESLPSEQAPPELESDETLTDLLQRQGLAPLIDQLDDFNDFLNTTVHGVCAPTACGDTGCVHTSGVQRGSGGGPEGV